MSIQTQIIKRLESLEDLEGVSVTVSGSTKGTVRVQHDKHHALDFLFKWSVDHFVGYFVDGESNQSQAVISLYSGLAAIRFATAYALLVELRANQKS